MRGNSTEFTLKELKILDRALISCKSQVVPKLTDLLVKETDITLDISSLKGTEDQIVG